MEYSKVNDRPYPRQRSGHRLVCSDKNLLLYGGYNPNNSIEVNADGSDSSCLFKELWKFDIVSQQWSLILGPSSNLPPFLASHAMILHGDLLMVFGGTAYPFGVNMSNKLCIFRVSEPQKNIEEVKTTGDPPSPGYGQSIVVHKNYLYVIGGTDGFSYTSDVHRLDLKTRSWEQVYQSRPDIREDPEPRYRHEVAYCERTQVILVIGGGTADEAFSLKDIPAFDLVNNCWRYIRTKPDLKLTSGYPENRKCHSLATHDHQVIIAGGNNGRKPYRDIWKLCLKTYQWTCLMTGSSFFPAQGLFFHDSCCTSDGLMFIFGGIKMRNGTALRTNVLHQMWITIPKLSAISWEALLHYFPHLRKVRREVLLEIGVPSRFASRIKAA